jgi:HEPN domain-containing protein
MADPRIVREWLIKADEDLDFAKINLDEDHAFYSQICFHFQQAAEKYLKAFVVAYDLEFEKMHNLAQLLKMCAKKDASLLSLMEQCELLSAAYIDTRYPVHWPTDYSRDKAVKMSAAADEIGAQIRRILKQGGFA